HLGLLRWPDDDRAYGSPSTGRRLAAGSGYRAARLEGARARSSVGGRTTATCVAPAIAPETDAEARCSRRLSGALTRNRFHRRANAGNGSVRRFSSDSSAAPDSSDSSRVEQPEMQLDSQVSFSESELILACLRVRYGSGCHADMQDRLRHGLNWHEILSTAQRHGIVPLLYEALSSNLSRLPADVRNGLRRNFQQNAANSFLYASELVRVTDCLRREPIPALAFKGPTLTAQLYGKLSLRTIRDLDILVGQEQMDSALKVLQRCGYSPVPGSGGRFSLSSKLQKHVLLANQSLGFRIELHWAISERSFAFGLSFDQLWAARRDVAILGAPVATVGPEDLLLILSAHGTNHCWGSLKWICDIAEAIRAFP